MPQKADKKWMERALELAKKGGASTLPNPMVGCVIVLNSEIIAEGYHKKFGESHAEVNALSMIPELSPEDLSKATAYVTLEPCSNFGKTPPCANLLIERGVGRVVTAMEDPNSVVSGRGHQLLSDSGIDVVTGILETKARLVNRKFSHLISSDLPYITLKWAQSKDGFMDPDDSALSGRGGVAITSLNTKREVHKLRSENSAILVGRKTAEVDNPSLDVREVSGTNPVRIVIDPEMKLGDLKMTHHKGETWIICKAGFERPVPGAKVRPWLGGSLPLMLRELRRNGIHTLLVEGGAFTHNKFIEEGCYNEMYVYTGPTELNGGLKSPLTTDLESGKVYDTNVGIDTLWHYIRR